MDRKATAKSATLRCAHCDREADVAAKGWHAYLIPAEAADDPGSVAVYCPICTELRAYGAHLKT